MSHADVLDMASEHEMRTTDIAVALQRGKAAPEQYRLPSGEWPTVVCVDCDGDIGAERLAAGRIRCFECQTAKEKRAARGLR